MSINAFPEAGFLLGIFFRGGKIYCYANFYCYSIVFRPNFREGQKFSKGENCLRGRPLPPCGKTPGGKDVMFQKLTRTQGNVGRRSEKDLLKHVLNVSLRKILISESFTSW